MAMSLANSKERMQAAGPNCLRNPAGPFWPGSISMLRLAISAVVGTMMMGAAALADAPVPDYAVTPLSQGDVAFYLDIMRAAAQHNSHLSGDDKAAVDYIANLHAHPQKMPAPGQMPTAAQTAELMRSAQYSQRAMVLVVYDMEIANERHVTARYTAVKGAVERAYAIDTVSAANAGAIQLAVMAQDKKQAAALMADKSLIAPHVVEIKTLKTQINSFMFGHGV
jgi:hypothetical protein